MTAEDLARALSLIAGRGGSDPERDHIVADRLLLEYINDPRVTTAYEAIERWYA